MKRTDNMISHTEQLKEETIQKIQEAIDMLQAEGREIKRKDIIEITGLSSAVLSKPHSKEVFKKNKVMMFAGEKVSAEELPDKYVILQKENSSLKKEIQKFENKNHNNEVAISYLKEKIDKQKDEYNILNNKYERLLGKFQMLLDKAERVGINLDELGLY